MASISRSDQVFAPDRKVRLGDPGVGSQDKHDCIGLRNQVHRQFRLGTDGVQTRGIENHQSLPEQRMRNIDERMTPFRHFDEPVGAGKGVVFRRAVVPEAERARFVLGYMPHFGDFFERLRQLRRIVQVQADLQPFFRCHAPFLQCPRLQTRFNGQQAQARRYIGVIAQFGWAHRGPARACRHDAAAITGKENCIDQFGFSARKLGHESHHDFI